MSESTTAPDPVERIRLVAISVALTVLVFVQRPGQISPDTKLDLSIDPAGFLARAVHLWEPLGDSGQLQNQAYGYFLPMGPFYLLGHALGLPAWAVQRCWWALILLVAFHGVYRLAGRMQLGSPAARMIGALAYALSPRVLTELGQVSIEVWPMAMAPWVLLPLIAVRPGRYWAASARSGLAVALTGGVNATATGTVLLLPLWWLLTRQAGQARRRLLAWWAVAVAAAIGWWLVPLVILGRYSPPFLDWIENAQVTTSRADPASAWRGTTQWVAWLRLPDPIWSAGWELISSPALVLLGWVLIALAAVGLLWPRTPHRAFLIGGVVGGLALLTLGHTGTGSPPWAEGLQYALDRDLAPLRNTHKFDLVLRLPLALALAHALTVIRVPPIKGLPWTRRGLAFAAACAVLGGATPALAGQIPGRGTFTAVPGYWEQAARWLARNDDGGRTLVLPGSTFATSLWGDSHDEPIQALARTPWAIRSAVPLSSAGNIRMLNAVEQQLATGRGSPGLAEYLARAGITRLLVRADLARDQSIGRTPRTLTVRAALLGSPGLRPVQAFGPTLGGNSSVLQAWDGGLDLPVPALEVWQVDRPSGPARVYSARSLLRVSGTPEGLLPLADAGVLRDRPVVLAGDPQSTGAPDEGPVGLAAPAQPWVLTDTPQRREASFPRVRDIYPPPLITGQPASTNRPQPDWMPFPRPLVAAVLDGGVQVTASGAASQAQDPWRAFDRDRASSWISPRFAVGQYLELTAVDPISPPAWAGVTFGTGGARVAAVDVRTDTGQTTTQIPAQPGPGPVRVAIPRGQTRTVRISVSQVWPGEQLKPVSVTEVAIAGVVPRRPLQVPAPPGQRRGSAPDLISLRADLDAADGCAFVAERGWCSPALLWPGTGLDLDRWVDLPGGARYRVSGTARPRMTPLVDRVLRPRGAGVVTASSVRLNEPAARPQAAFDDDPATTWYAADRDERPTLRLRWSKPRRVAAVRWFLTPGVFASRPATMTVVTGNRRQSVAVDEDGWARFAPVRTRGMDLIVETARVTPSRDSDLGLEVPLPVGVSEVIAPALDDLRIGPDDRAAVSLPCGQGPTLVVGERRIRTALTGTAGQLLRRAPMTVRPCPDRVDLPSGRTRIRLEPTTEAAPHSLLFTRESQTADAGPAGRAPRQFRQLTPEHRVVDVAASAAEQLLVVRENANPGWRATLDGRPLTAVRIDGWQQGWLVPAAGGRIELRFTPGAQYRAGLVAGGIALGLLMLVVLAGVVLDRWRGPARPEAEVLPGRAQSLPEGTTGYGASASLVLVGAGGWWAVAAVACSAVLARLGSTWLIVVACGSGTVAAVAAALNAGGDDVGMAAGVATAASLLLGALLAASLWVPARAARENRPGPRPRRGFAWRWAVRRPDPDVIAPGADAPKPEPVNSAARSSRSQGGSTVASGATAGGGGGG